VVVVVEDDKMEVGKEMGMADKMEGEKEGKQVVVGVAYKLGVEKEEDRKVEEMEV